MRTGRGERGVALILVLGIVLMLSVLSMSFSFTMQVETRLASLRRKQLKAEAAARAGIEIARHLIWLDMGEEYNDGSDSFVDIWAYNPEWLEDHPLGDGTVTVRIRPEDSKMDLNATPTEIIREILYRYDIDPSHIDVMVDSLEDWIDVDNVRKLNGAEDEDYQRLDPPYECKDGPLDSIEELLLVNGFDEEILYGLRPMTDGAEQGPRLIDLFTVGSGGRINVNTAPAEILAVLPGFDAEMAQAIVDYRNGDDGMAGTEDDRPFLSVGELTSVTGMDAATLRGVGRILGVQSVFFRVRSEGRVGEARRVVEVLLRRDQDEVRVVGWYDSGGV